MGEFVADQTNGYRVWGRERPMNRTVMLVDDHPVFRRGLRRVLEDTGRFTVVAEASNAHEAIHLADIHQPDLILLDVNLPGVTGLRAGRALRRQQPRARLVYLSMHIDDDRLVEAVRVGASAYFSKDADSAELISGLQRVVRGEDLISEVVLRRPALAMRVLSEMRNRQNGGVVDETVALSAREIEVLDCVAHGMSNKEIADALYLTEQTVKNHVTAVLRKLEAEDRVQMLRAAAMSGWIELGPQWYQEVAESSKHHNRLAGD